MQPRSRARSQNLRNLHKDTVGGRGHGHECSRRKHRARHIVGQAVECGCRGPGNTVTPLQGTQRVHVPQHRIEFTPGPLDGRHLNVKPGERSDAMDVGNGDGVGHKGADCNRADAARVRAANPNRSLSGTGTGGPSGGWRSGGKVRGRGKVRNLGYGASASIADDLTRVNTLPLSSVKLANYTSTGMAQLASTRLPATGLGRSVYLKRVTPDHWIRFD